MGSSRLFICLFVCLFVCWFVCSITEQASWNVGMWAWPAEDINTMIGASDVCIHMIMTRTEQRCLDLIIQTSMNRKLGHVLFSHDCLMDMGQTWKARILYKIKIVAYNSNAPSTFNTFNWVTNQISQLTKMAIYKYKMTWMMADTLTSSCNLLQHHRDDM